VHPLQFSSLGRPLFCFFGVRFAAFLYDSGFHRSMALCTRVFQVYYAKNISML